MSRSEDLREEKEGPKDVACVRGSKTGYAGYAQHTHTPSACTQTKFLTYKWAWYFEEDTLSRKTASSKAKRGRDKDQKGGGGRYFLNVSRSNGKMEKRGRKKKERGEKYGPKKGRGKMLQKLAFGGITAFHSKGQ